MPLSLNAFERFYLLRLNAGPGPMLDVLGGMSFYAVSAAVRLGLFDQLGGDARSSADLAGALSVSERGLAVLLEVLCSLGYVRVRRGRYRNSAMTRKWLVAASQSDISDAFRYYHETMAELWPHLDESVRRGTAHQQFYPWLAGNRVAAEGYQRFMMRGSSMILDELMPRLALPARCRSLVDVGGGHGAYAVAVAATRSDLAVTVFDSPSVAGLARANIAGHGLADRVGFTPGDYLRDPLPGRYDAAFLFNVIHQHRDHEIVALLDSIRSSLNPGGTLYLLDSTRTPRMGGLAAAFIRLYGMVHFHFLGGDNHHDRAVRQWLGQTGFGRIRTTRLLRSGMVLYRCERTRE